MKGKVYKIVCNETNLCYIGSTTNKYLSTRLGQHVFRFNNKEMRQYASSKIIEGGNYKIELLEELEYDEKPLLLERERHWIENTDCENKNIPSRTKEEYRELNKEKQKKYMDVYYKENKQKQIDRVQEWRNNNRERFNASRRKSKNIQLKE